MNTKLIRFDWAMKTLLRDKANFDILEGFLSAVLREEVQVLQILEHKPTHFDKEINYLDVLIKDSKQQYMVIDLQNHFMVAPYLLESILSGGAKVLTNNIELNQNYREVGKIISICILHFDIGLGSDYIYYGNTELRGLHDNHSPIFQRRGLDETLEKFKSQTIFPEYYLINVEGFADVIKTDLDEWIYFLKHSEVRSDFNAKHIDKVSEKLVSSKMNCEEYSRYQYYMMYIVNMQDQLNTAFSQGFQDGIALGIAKKMLGTGMDIKTIAAMTGLSPSEITDLNKI